MRNQFVLWNFLVFGWLATSCCAQQFAGILGANSTFQNSPGSASQVKVNVSGTVVNSVTGEPIRRALVELNGPTPRSAFTGADGRFQLLAVQEGQAWMTAQKPGFFGDQQLAKSGHFRGSSTRISTGMSDVVLKLVPAGRIVGQVVNSEGEPVDGVNIQVSEDQIMNGRKRRQMRGGGSSDDTGRFVVENLQPGTYYLNSATHQALEAFNHVFLDDIQPPAYPPVYYPNSPDEASAQPIELKPGQDVAADFTLRSEPMFRVSGQAIGATAGLQVMEQTLGRGMPTFHPVRYDGKTGRFVLYLTSGSWRLKFSSNDRQQMVSATQEVEVRHANVDNLQVALVPGTSIPIQVDRSAVTATAAANPGAVPQLTMGNLHGPSVQQVQMSLHGTNGEEIAAMWDAPVNGETENRQTFRNVPSGSYRVSAQSFGSACVGSVSEGGVDLMRQELVVTEGSQMPPIVVALRSDCGSIQATVHAPSTESGLADGTLLLIPDANPDQARVMPVQPNNATKVSGLSPGEYKIYALSNVDGLEYANPEALKSFPSQHVTVDANGSASVNLDLVSRGSQ